MSQDVANVNLVSIIVHGSDQSNFVAADIEDGEFPDLVGVRKGFPQLNEIRNRSFRRSAYQRARDGAAAGCFSANSFKRFLVMTCMGEAKLYR